MVRKRLPQEKIERLEAAADRLLARGKATAALKKYREVQQHAPDRPAIYRKLIQAHQIATTTWSAADFAESLSWEMRQQELEHPELKGVHERLSPEWQEVTERARRLLVTDDARLATQLTEEIVGFREKAVRPLIAILLELTARSKEPV